MSKKLLKGVLSVLLVLLEFAAGAAELEAAPGAGSVDERAEASGISVSVK